VAAVKHVYSTEEVLALVSGHAHAISHKAATHGATVTLEVLQRK
jgi:hypothetical protein